MMGDPALAGHAQAGKTESLQKRSDGGVPSKVHLLPQLAPNCNKGHPHRAPGSSATLLQDESDELRSSRSS